MASLAFDERASSPDEEAGRLYEEHSEWLLGHCRRQLGGSLDDAEDAVQTTFMYAFRALRRGVVPECERAWLTTIARNVCSTQRRTRDRHPEDTAVDLERIALARPEPDEAGFADDVRSALATLPENQRHALVRREWQGVGSWEIAEELQLSEPATHALLFRARKSFANALTATGRPFGGLNAVGLAEWLRVWLKPLLGGSAAKAAVVTTAVGVVVGGVALEQRVDRGTPPAMPSTPTRATETGPRPDQGGATVVHGAVSPADVARDRREVGRGTSGPGPSTAPAGGGPVGHPVRPPKGVATPAPASPPTARDEEPSGTSPPTPDPPAVPPVPVPPVELPPILGDEPPVELPPILGEELPVDPPAPLDEVVPPLEVPPVELPPLLP